MVSCLLNGRSTKSFLCTSLETRLHHQITILLCVISKLLERLIYNKIFNTVSNSITPHQYGFQGGSSTLQQLIVYFHQLITSKEEIDVIYIDFHKASVPHNDLLIKLYMEYRYIWYFMEMVCVSFKQ